MRRESVWPFLKTYSILHKGVISDFSFIGLLYVFKKGHTDSLRNTTFFLYTCQMLGTDVDKVAFDGSYVFVDEDEEEEKKVSLEQVALKGTFFNNIELQVVKQHSSPLSPPPFMVGMAEV